MLNRIKRRLECGKAVLNAWLAIPSGFSAEVMAQCGWDSVTVDLQHGVQDYLSMVRCFQAMAAHPVTPLVRVAWNEPGMIGKVLDGGAWGVICPMINTPDDARRPVEACLYPPRGKRSNGPIRAAMYGEFSNYQKIANDEVLVMPMIETREAIDNVEAILDVPGLSGIYVGPSDLSLSLGLTPSLDREEPGILAIYEKLVAAAGKRSLFTGLHSATSAYAARMIQIGFRFVTIGNDSGLIARAARDAVTAFRIAAGPMAS